MPDPNPNQPALIQKLGGWTRYYPNAMPATPRALWAWEDTQAVKRLAVGTDISNSTGVSFLGFITGGQLTDITPRVQQDNVPPNVTLSTASTFARIIDNSITTTEFDTVFIATHIAVGSMILYGSYLTLPFSATTYDVTMRDALGNPVMPPVNVSNGGAVAVFNATSGSAIIDVSLNNHGYIIGDTYPVMVETTVGGVTLSGNAIVQAVIDQNTFRIFGRETANSTETKAINGGSARYNYYLSFAPNPPGVGYGVGGYGEGGYGSGTSPTPSTGTQIATRDWNLDNFGEVLLSLPTLTTFGSPDNDTEMGGPIFYWSPSLNLINATAIWAGPSSSAGMFVAMPQRQIVAYGTTVTGVPDPLLVRWCDVDNFFQWIGQVTNQAGQFRIPRGSKIVGGMQVSTQGLLWTDLGLWVMQYIGPGNVSRSVYSFNEVGVGCGLIAQKATGTIGGVVYWMGPSQFYTYAGGVQPVQCPVWDYIFPRLFPGSEGLIRCATNSNFNEIEWFFASADGNGEVDSYVKMNVTLGDTSWDIGQLPRSAWINQSVVGPPVGADPTTNYIQQHETSNDADGQPLLASFTTGYFVLSEADVLMFVDQVWPDMKWGYPPATNAEVLLTFYVVEYPTDQNPRTYGPFTLSTAVRYITPRFRGRLVAMKFENVDIGTFWRLGNMRYRFQPDGKFL